MGRSTEIVGELEEILGGSNLYGSRHFEETVGALPPGYPAPRLIPGGASVMSRPATKSRQQILPLSSSGTIAASTAVAVTAQPQAVFRPERWVITDANNNFTVQDLKIGMNSQFINAGTVPSAVFGQGAFGVRLKMDTCQVSMFVTAQVTNTDGGAPHQFLSAVIGPTVM